MTVTGSGFLSNARIPDSLLGLSAASVVLTLAIAAWAGAQTLLVVACCPEVHVHGPSEAWAVDTKIGGAVRVSV